MMLDLSLFLEQATAEQIRLAQMISDHNDADFEEKVKQVSRCTASWCPNSSTRSFPVQLFILM